MGDDDEVAEFAAVGEGAESPIPCGRAAVRDGRRMAAGRIVEAIFMVDWWVRWLGVLIVGKMQL